MTEVWKSNPRHFCEFCKCWIADNKPSKDFHEKGKRHQENVKKRINDMQKRSKKKQEEEAEVAGWMRDMERKATAAFKKDIASSPALSAAYQQKLQEKQEVDGATELPGCAPAPAPKPQHPKTRGPKHQQRKSPHKAHHSPSQPPSSSPAPAPATSPWQIAFSDEGYPYFWNTQTGEVQWTKPADYVSPYSNQFGVAPQPPRTETSADQQPPLTETYTQQQPQHPETCEPQPESQPESLPQPEIEQAPLRPENDAGAETAALPNCPAEIPLPPPATDTSVAGKTAMVAGETAMVAGETAMVSGETGTVAGETASVAGETAASESSAAAVSGGIVAQRGAKVNLPRVNNTATYGQWQHIPEPKPQKKVDYQLPSVKKHEEVKTITVSEPKFKFRTKTANPIADGLVAFKKRKLAGGARNIKQREDDR